MSVPFSNTNLRVPRGFGNILEGLAREVLRDQPDDIPAFAAKYFTALLKEREESGLDVAEWGARLEDRFYNNHAFKDTENRGNSSSAKASGNPVNEAKTNQAKSSENNGGQINQPVQGSDSPESHNASEDRKELEPQQSNEFKNIQNEDSGEADPEPTTNISYSGTADVDICAEGLKDMEEIKGQMAGNIDHTGSVSGENETPEKDVCAAELEPTHLSSDRDVADIEICAEEQQSTLQEEESTYEHAEDNSNLIDANLARVLESPKFFLVGELPEPHEVQDSNNEFTPSGAKSPAHPEQEADEEVNDISASEKTVTPSTKVEDEDETDYFYEHAQNTVSEMSDDLFEGGPEDSHIDQFNLHEAKGNTNDMFDDGITERAAQGTVNPEAQEVLPETEVVSETLSAMGKVSIEDGEDNSRAECENILNIASELQGGDDFKWDRVNDDEIIHDGIMSSDHQQSASGIDAQEDEKNINREADLKDLNTDIFDTGLDAPVEKQAGWMDNSTDLTAEDGEEGDRKISHQVETEDTTGTDDQEDCGTNEAEMMNEYHLFDGKSVVQAGEVSCGPMSNESVEDTEVTQERHAEEGEAEEDETDTGLEEQSGTEKAINQDLLRGNESKEMGTSENKNDLQVI